MYTARGGAFLVTFPSPTDAVLCALEVQALRERDGAHVARPVRFVLRQVVSTGEVWLEPDDVCGAPVDLAGRLQEALSGGGVFLTESTWLVMDKARLPAERLGALAREDFPEGVRVFRARPLMPGEGASRSGIGWHGEARRRTAQAALVLRGLMRRVRDLTWKQAGRVALVLGLLAAPLGAVLAWRWPSRAEVALEALARAPEAERDAKAREVEALLGQEQDVGVRAFLQGRLRELLGEPRLAVEDYRVGAEAGHREAIARLVALLGHAECPVRAAAARTLGGLSVEEAREPLRELAERGPDGGSDRCGSRRAAAQALRKLEGAPR
ncbi:hypothetical protein [Pyxidicoccus trucidator]|uniref:hypothetical protein n=1 Tax=Pyxidicoccus trucidator TaxID=2709662 RepID=UPI0013DD3517|nr:hypothetical protein [Pyxidicoccus trucidator]